MEDGVVRATLEVEFCLAPVVYAAQVMEGPESPGPVAAVRKQLFNLSIYCANPLSDVVVWTDHGLISGLADQL